MDKTTLGDRMKIYESVSSPYLMRRTPVIIRVDGRAFHTLTRRMEKPYDYGMFRMMSETAVGLCEEIDGCKLAYFQSDEISLVLTDYDTLDTQPWFGYRVQKVCSVAASTATAYFNRVYLDLYPEATTLPTFDARVFNLPQHEVVNYMIWRQQDAVRNSIQGLGQANFSQKQLHGKSCDQIQEMLFQEKRINWDKVETQFKRGACVVKGGYDKVEIPSTSFALGGVITGLPHDRWTVDLEIPIFTQDRWYVDKRVLYPEGK